MERKKTTKRKKEREKEGKKKKGKKGRNTEKQKERNTERKKEKERKEGKTFKSIKYFGMGNTEKNKPLVNSRHLLENVLERRVFTITDVKTLPWKEKITINHSVETMQALVDTYLHKNSMHKSSWTLGT